MTKGLATAVLWAITSFLGSTEPADWQADLDDTGDGIVDLVEISETSGRSRHGAILAIASVACGERIDHAWVIGQATRPAGAIAIHTASDVAQLNLAVESPEMDALAVASSLLPRALAECRELGMLKVTIEADNLDTAALAPLAQSCGYHFSRMRKMNGVNVCEFYTDLYWRQTEPPATS